MPTVHEKGRKATRSDVTRYRGGGMDERWRDLAASIIEQSVRDYRRAIIDHNTKRKMDCITFFLSDWFKVLSGGIDGAVLLRRLRRRYG